MRRMVVMRLKCLWRLRRRMRTIRSSMMPRMIAKTDTSLAIEAIFMKRWEFDSIEQATKCISSWFSGTHHEQLLLKGYVESAIDHFAVHSVFVDHFAAVHVEESNNKVIMLLTMQRIQFLHHYKRYLLTDCTTVFCGLTVV
ncbi:hypothetical protein LOK49_LG06G00629 [Camellia lanceoleosa]|uniref:Uncharacterized protein n=1 Tax=Camellia lanceoleosa TaxID=1840588 RepID=A0ACC0HF23_9ERIC|nr:hypothetical protein LOK49_LG06G00629 [Camellia lanceoleosa]